VLKDCIVIVWRSGEKSKTNFYDRTEVIHAVSELMYNRTVSCTVCFGNIRYHCSYQRNVTEEDGTRLCGWVVQGHCAPCNVYHSILPEFIMPHKQYSSTVIESAVNELEKGGNIEEYAGCTADVSTMRRWYRQFRNRGADAVRWMLAILHEIHACYLGAYKLHNKKLLMQLRRLLCEFPDISHLSVFSAVNIILTTRNLGFL